MYSGNINFFFFQLNGEISEPCSFYEKTIQGLLKKRVGKSETAESGLVPLRQVTVDRPTDQQTAVMRRQARDVTDRPTAD
jgi:hypothetical protein